MSERYQKIFAIIFLILLFGFSGYNIYSSWEDIVEDVKEQINIESIVSSITEEYDFSSLEEAVQNLNTIINTNLVGGHIWNEIYGATYAALGKNEENNFAYIKDKDGIEYYANFWNTPDITMKELAKRMKRMKDDLEPKGTKVILLLYPTRYDTAWADGYYGLPYQDYNKAADEFLRYLRRYDVDYIDYREVFKDSGLRGEEIFYKTDHHWNTTAAYYATTKLVDHIRDSFGEDLDPQGKYCDINSYFLDEYEAAFMGSMGRETGEVYGGRDDFSCLSPKFETSVVYSYYTSNKETKVHEGNFTQTIIQKNRLRKDDIYEKDLNNVYMSGVQLADKIENQLAENDTSVFMIRNSYSSPVAVFLSPMVKSVDCVWGLNLSEESIMKQLNENDYDYVIVAVNVDNFDNEGNFSFYTEETEKDDADSEVDE